MNEKTATGRYPRFAVITQGNYIMNRQLHSTTVTVVQRADVSQIQPRLILLEQRINTIRADMPPYSCRPLETASAIIQTAITLEAINFDVMQSVVSALTDAAISFALFSSHGVAVVSCLDLAEDILADLPISYTVAPDDPDDDTQPITVPPFVPTVPAFSQE